MKKEINKLYDTGIFITYMSEKQTKRDLEDGFIKKVKGHKNIYITDMSFFKIT